MAADNTEFKTVTDRFQKFTLSQRRWFLAHMYTENTYILCMNIFFYQFTLFIYNTSTIYI